MERKSAEERFWANVKKTRGCWKWTGGTSDGRGYFYWDGRQGLAYRYSWELHIGPIPKGKQINHKCDNPGCVRPDHLYIGTQQDNMTDKRVRKRSAVGAKNGTRTKPERVARGERHGNATLSDAAIKEMRERYAGGGLSQNDLSREYGITQAAINSIILGKTRSDAGGPITRRGRTNLTKSQVKAIRKKHAMGIAQTRIAKDLGIGYNAVNEVCTGKTHTGTDKRRRSSSNKRHAKLTASQVQEIRDHFSKGTRQTDLATEYGVARSTISAIVLRRTW